MVVTIKNVKDFRSLQYQGVGEKSREVLLPELLLHRQQQLRELIWSTTYIRLEVEHRCREYLAFYRDKRSRRKVDLTFYEAIFILDQLHVRECIFIFL